MEFTPKYKEFFDAITQMETMDVLQWTFEPHWNKDTLNTKMSTLKSALGVELKHWYYQGRVFVVRYA